MNVLRKIAQSVRHHPALEKADWLWPLVRKPYHWVLDPMGKGVSVLLGARCEVRIPLEYSGFRWEEFEPETFAFLNHWVSSHPNALVLDIGSSTGIFSAAALFAGPKVQVVAIEPDLASLATTRRMTRYASGERLRLVYGFIAEQSTQVMTLEAAAAATELALARGSLGSERYQSLLDPDARSIPHYRLDDLLADGIAEQRSILVKCDVEGAELEVLMGASATLKRLRPDLLLSIHSWNEFGLPQYGHSKADVEAFLRDHDYVIDCIAVDHEEHWACQYRAPVERSSS